MDGGFELQADLPGPGHEIKDVEVLWRLRGIVAGGGPNGTVGIGLAPVLRVYTEPHDATLVRTTFAAPVTFRRQMGENQPGYVTFGASVSAEYVTDHGIGIGGTYEMFCGPRTTGEGPGAMYGAAASLSLSYGF